MPNLRWIAAVVAAGLALAACGHAGGRVPLARAGVAGALSSPTFFSAAGLRSMVAGTLERRVFLVGIDARSVNEPATAAAVSAALDDNSHDLSGIVAGLYGAAAGEQFLELWQGQARHLHAFALAEAVDDERRAAGATAGLDAFRDDLVALLGAADPDLRRSDLAASITRATDATLAAIRVGARAGARAGFGAPTGGGTGGGSLVGPVGQSMPDALVTAAAAAADEGVALARPVAAQKQLGPVDSPAARFEAQLVGDLQRGTFLLALAADGRADDAVSARLALDRNDAQLAALLSDGFGGRLQPSFADLWRGREELVARFALDAAGIVAVAGPAAARSALAGNEAAVRNLLLARPVETSVAVTSSDVDPGPLAPVAGLLDAITSRSAGDPSWATVLNAAAEAAADSGRAYTSLVAATLGGPGAGA